MLLYHSGWIFISNYICYILPVLLSGIMHYYSAEAILPLHIFLHACGNDLYLFIILTFL